MEAPNCQFKGLCARCEAEPGREDQSREKTGASGKGNEGRLGQEEGGLPPSLSRASPGGQVGQACRGKGRKHQSKPPRSPRIFGGKRDQQSSPGQAFAGSDLSG
jgi:hypothetical protein